MFKNSKKKHLCEKKECIHVCVTGSPCCTVEKKISIGEIKINKFKKEKASRINNGK